MADAVNAGTVVWLVGMFTDPNNASAAIDPTKVGTAYNLTGGAWTWAQYGFSAMVKDSVGDYHLALDTTGLDGDDILYRYYGKGTAQVVSNEDSVPVNAVEYHPTWS